MVVSGSGMESSRSEEVIIYDNVVYFHIISYAYSCIVFVHMIYLYCPSGYI